MKTKDSQCVVSIGTGCRFPFGTASPLSTKGKQWHAVSIGSTGAGGSIFASGGRRAKAHLGSAGHPLGTSPSLVKHPFRFDAVSGDLNNFARFWDTQ